MSKSHLLVALLAVGIAAPAWSQEVDPPGMLKCDPSKGHCVSAIAFTSLRDGNLEIYLMTMNEDDTVDTVIRVSKNDDGDGFPKLSPDGKRIVFDSNRARGAEPLNTSDLFLMKADGKDQRLLTRGSSATWSPDGKYIAFHRSASGMACPLPVPDPNTPGCPIKDDPGAATADSDIFVARVSEDDGLIEELVNITNSPMHIDEDPDWSPDGQKIVFTRHDVNDPDSSTNPTSAEIYVVNPDGTGLMRLTNNLEEERAPVWSPVGTRIAYMCRRGIQGGNPFEICVMNADGSGQTQLTDNSVFEGTGTWSLDGNKIVFQRQQPGGQQLWIMNANGSDQTQLTFPRPPGANLFPSWGRLWVGGHD